MLESEFQENPVWMPTLETNRLILRPFLLQDLPDVYRILDVETRQEPRTLAERENWLRWTIAGYTEYARLLQFPFGDRAIVLRDTGDLIGVAGFVPCVDSFNQIPAFKHTPDRIPAFATAEVGLFWAVTTLFQRLGFASEAAAALIQFAFSRFNLERIVATTAYDNQASIAVMRKLGMDIQRNPHEEPAWLQIVGILTNPNLPV